MTTAASVDSQTVIHVLLVEDNPGDAELAREALAESPARYRFVTHHVTRLDDALKRLAVEPVDVILLDLTLSDAAGLEGLERLRRTIPEAPVVVFTGLADENTAVAAVHLGSQDYLVKGSFDGPTLSRTLRYAIERHRLTTELEKSRRIIEEANHRLRELDRMKTLLLSNVSHELRTPLTSVEGFAENLRDGLMGPVSDRQRQGLDRILANARRLRKLIDDLLDMSRMEGGGIRLRLQPFNIRALVEDLAEDFRPQCAERRIALSTRPPPEPVQGWGDIVRIRQVLDNLIANALKFTPEAGCIDIAVSADAGGNPTFSVCDTGVGIPEGERARIFDRFYQAGRPSSASSTGFGLGLAICRELVELHGGTIWVDSRPGGGSAFSFRIPAARREPSDRPDGAENTASPGGEGQGPVP